ncbi:hypothetical protein [Achromobacter sp. MFA1 R4]|uniref:hypothetical protein n=1 Tax=Achromobacter sp. MFA1 R4 TaxID=1881016 RepID=UPI0012EB527D|nr:hypothetical protein [Achromobacter sp. MFA1 R4]
MKMSKGELTVWQAIGSVLKTEDPVEYEMLPEIVEMHSIPATDIGRQPGAFDAGQIQLVAGVLFGIASSVMQMVLPKLFDAALDIGKDALKKELERRASCPSTPPELKNRISVSCQQIREAIFRAAADRKLSPRTAAALADALIAQFIGAEYVESAKT